MRPDQLTLAATIICLGMFVVGGVLLSLAIMGIPVRPVAIPAAVILIWGFIIVLAISVAETWYPELIRLFSTRKRKSE